MPTKNSVSTLNLDESWQELQGILKADIIPSTQRIQEYIEVCLQRGELGRRLNKLFAYMVDVLRLEEQTLSIEPALKEILFFLESDNLLSYAKVIEIRR